MESLWNCRCLHPVGYSDPDRGTHSIQNGINVTFSLSCGTEARTTEEPHAGLPRYHPQLGQCREVLNRYITRRNGAPQGTGIGSHYTFVSSPSVGRRCNNRLTTLEEKTKTQKWSVSACDDNDDLSEEKYP